MRSLSVSSHAYDSTGALTAHNSMIHSQSRLARVGMIVSLLNCTMLIYLQLTCFERNPVVRFSFEFKVGSDENSALGYRFDDKPGRDNVASRILLGYTVIVIEDKAAVAQFIDELVNSSTLYLRIRSLNAGRTTAEFRVAGAAAAVQAALAECPVAALQKRTS